MLYFLKYKKVFIISLMLLSLLVMAQVALAADYNPSDPVGSSGLSETASEGYGVAEEDLLADENKNDLSTIIGKVVGAALSFLGIAFFILMIYGGYTWMFSMGNEQTSAKAKEIIIAAVIGLAIVLMAYVLTRFIAGIFPDVTGVKSE